MGTVVSTSVQGKHGVLRYKNPAFGLVMIRDHDSLPQKWCGCTIFPTCTDVACRQIKLIYRQYAHLSRCKHAFVRNKHLTNMSVSEHAHTRKTWSGHTDIHGPLAHTRTDMNAIVHYQCGQCIGDAFDTYSQMISHMPTPTFPEFFHPCTSLISLWCKFYTGALRFHFTLLIDIGFGRMHNR
jgi:hypothetical protein